MLVLFAVLCGVTSSATAGPRRAPMTSADPQVQEAERLWKLAETESDRQKRTELWEDTSAAFASVVAAKTLPTAELDAAATAALLALRNAFHIDAWALAGTINLKDPDATPEAQPLPPRQKRMLWVIDTVRQQDATSTESIAARFFAGVTLHRFDHLDDAIAIFVEIIDNHPRHNLAEAALHLALDTYNRLRKRDALLALVEHVRGNKDFLVGRAALAKRLDRISYDERRTALELAENQARKRGNYKYGECGEPYLALVSVAGNEADEMLTRASSCFARAGSADRALAAARMILEKYPTSKLVAQTHAGIANLEARIGNFATAAASWERAWKAYELRAPGRYEARVSATNAVYYRIQLGEWARVDALLTRIVKAYPPSQWDEIEYYLFDAVKGALAAGRRADAARWMMQLPPSPAALRVDDMTTVLLDVSCPVTPVDGLCPRKRTPKLLASARRYLSYEDSDHSILLGLSLDLEVMLATKAPASTLAALATKLDSFTDPARDPDVRVLAHARLARIARETKDAAAQRTHLDACMRDASDAFVEQPTLVWCERELVALKVPVAELRELLPLAVHTVIASEPAL